LSAVVDSAVLIDALRGHPAAGALLRSVQAVGDLHASEITRVEILAGMRRGEEEGTRAVLGALFWHPVDTEVAEMAAQFGRAWLPNHNGIDTPDLIVAATAQLLELPLLTTNVKHFPMFGGLKAPY
jgi:predicted nucleic acid-binding protein